MQKYWCKDTCGHESLDVISNISPVRIRIRLLCTREFARIMRKPKDSSLYILSSSAAIICNIFTLMSYLKYISRDLASEIEGGGRRTVEQDTATKAQVDKFWDPESACSLTCFTDGSVKDDALGMGSWAAVLLQPLAHEQPIVKTEVFVAYSQIALRQRFVVLR